MKAGVMAWIDANWVHVSEAIQEGNVHLPIKKHSKSLRATDVKWKIMSKLHGRYCFLRSFIQNQPVNAPIEPTPEPPRFKILGGDSDLECDS
jgi:hypothetical protein